MKRKRRRVEIDIERLDGIVESSRERPLDDQERNALHTALHEMASRLAGWRNSEKASQVLDTTAPETPPPLPPAQGKAKKGHGRNGADAFPGAERVAVPHPDLQPGCPCPECHKGKVYPQRKEPSPIIRFKAGPPISATIYELDALRCNACQEIFRAQPPPGVGPDKYDETAASMVAVTKYGYGVPFNRLEGIQKSLGVPLPASTQWELVEDAAEVLQPVHQELIRQTAQGEVLHSDDTSVKILDEVRPPEHEDRTGQFTTGLVANLGDDVRVALFITGTRHAGENTSDVLRRRAEELDPAVLMCDALNRNPPKMGSGVEVLLANCLVHGRRNFVEAYSSFPEACLHVLETLGKVYAVDAAAKAEGLDPKQRLQYHQQHSEPIMKELRQWLTAQLEEKLTEPNSRLGKAMKYLLTHWAALTLFLRHPGAPLDNNVCERALKKVVLHRKNALFFRTMNGAQVGDLFMSLIYTCELNGVNPFVYLTELQRHQAELRAAPGSWMPWNYHTQLGNSQAP